MNFEPDEEIKSIRVVVHTADVYAAGTDDNIYCRLIQIPNATKAYQFQLDGGFERGDSNETRVPDGYFAGRIMNDLSIVQLYKDAEGTFECYGGWGFKQIEIWVNGKSWYQSAVGEPLKWLEGGDRHWTAPDPEHFLVPFTDPTFQAPDFVAEPTLPYEQTLTIHGGKAPFTLQITPDQVQDMNVPSIHQATAGNPRVFRLAGTAGPDGALVKGHLSVTDARGVAATQPLSVVSRAKLPAPAIAAVAPDFGWRAAPPMADGASLFEITGDNFYGHAKAPLRVDFTGADGGTAAAFAVLNNIGSLTATVPQDAVSGPITVTTPSGSAATAPVTIHPSGYRFRSGFPFLNRQKDDDGSDGFPNTFAWGRYEEAYGVDGMWIMSPFGAVCPDPWSAIFYLATKDFIDDGCCHGFSLTSLRIRQGVIGDAALPVSGNPYPLSGTLYDKADGNQAPATTVSNLIQVGQLAMMSAEALGFYALRFGSIPSVSGDVTQMDARPMLGDVTAMLKDGGTDPRMIAFAKNANPINGHVVVPHAVTGNVVHVYNCNDPAFPEGATDDPRSRFLVNADGSWAFDMGTADKPEKWNGIYCFTIPLSAYGHCDHWSIVTLESLLLSVIGYLGHCVGGAGATVEPLDGSAEPLPSRGPRPIHGMKGPVTRFRVTAGAEPAMVSITLGTGEAIAVEEISGSVTVTVDHDARTVSVGEDALAGDIRPVVRLVRRDAARSRSETHAIRAAAGAAPGTVGLGWADAHPRAVAGVAAVDLHTRRLDALAHDDALELAGVPAADAHGATLALDAGGGLTVTRADGRPAALDGARHFRSALPPQLVVGEQRVTAALRSAGRLAGAAATAPAPVRPIDPRRLFAIRHDAGGGIAGLGGIGRVVADGGAVNRLDPRRLPPVAPIVAPHPVEAPPPGAAVAIDVDLGGASGLLAVRGQPAAVAEAGRLRLDVEAGTHLVSVVQQVDGYRSFPRPLLVSTGSERQLRSPFAVLAEAPGIVRTHPLGLGRGRAVSVGGAAVPLTLVTGGAAVTAVTLDLLDVAAVCGGGRGERPNLSFALSPALQALGATLSMQPSRAGITVGIGWSADAPQAGRIALGTLEVGGLAAPASVWTVGGAASVRLAAGGDADCRMVPVEVRVPGAVPAAPAPGGGRTLPPGLDDRLEPVARFGLAAPSSVGEGEEAELSVAGLGAGPAEVGWWVSGLGGRATIATAGAKATVKGAMAGAVRVHALVGEAVLTRDLRVDARPGWSAMAADRTGEIGLLPTDAAPAAVGSGPIQLIPTQGLKDRVWNPGDFSRLGDLVIDTGMGLATTPFRAGPAVGG